MKFLQLDFLGSDDLKRLAETISGICGVRNEKVALNTIEAISLVRAECIKLAVTLKEHIADDGSFQAGSMKDEQSCAPRSGTS
ncbi:hypothetical protein QA640_39270 [Bradyrhizobium sp. CB82]|uniref:hypothetical protein n=1 Tax=Bradyrhizobium sp. CB82 TaxID=3039159 RepID=UPI0024B1BCFE|nr:hypothetical protein [Bradyrhizobium sp. CB82]WFU40183.1 hypothetical protein QA640_39270 [Bradyrhizobium sp. CB82]